MLGQMTPEQRSEMLEKAKETRRIKKEEGEKYANENLKLNYADMSYWKSLSSQVGFIMPVWYEQYNPKRVRKLLKKINRDTKWLKEHWGVCLPK
jgi:hypothetical protein